MIAHYTYKVGTKVTAHRSVEDHTLRLVETPAVVEWHIEDEDVVRYMEISNKVSWVVATREAHDARTGSKPGLKVAVEAYNAIAEGIADGTITTSKVWSVAYSAELPW